MVILPSPVSFHAQMREELYQILGSLASSVASFYQAAATQPAWAAALVGDLDVLINPHLRLAMRHIYIPLVKACPPTHRQAACPPQISHSMIRGSLLIALSESLQACCHIKRLSCVRWRGVLASRV